MELFKIIKKVFDLTRNEVQQVLKDSKAYAKSLVDAEATRADAKVNNLETSIKDDLYHKVGSSLYIKTTDISNKGYLSGEIDAEFLEWNILRRVFTKGVVGKTSGDFKYVYKDSDTTEATFLIGKNTFFDSSDPLIGTRDGRYFGGIKALYNVELANNEKMANGEIMTYHGLFEEIDAYYISCKNINEEYKSDCTSMFEYCTNLIHIDFKIPTKGSRYTRVFFGCYNLEHTNFDINWPNADKAEQAFFENRSMRNDIDSKLNVTLPIATDVTQMFHGCKKLRYVNNFYAPQAAGYGLFSACESLESISGTIEFMGGNSLDNMFVGCKKLYSPITIIIPNDLVYEANNMFQDCLSLRDAPSLPGTIHTAMGFFRGCSSLKSIPLYKFADGIMLQNAFEGCASLTDLGGFDGLTTSLRLADSPLLSRESCLNLFNYAGTVETTSNRAFSINATAYSRLSEEDIAIAVNKGWAVQSV